MSALIIADHNNQQLNSSTLSLVKAALQVSDKVEVLLAGFQCQTVLENLNRVVGISRIHLADADCFKHQSAEVMVPLIKGVAEQYNYIFAAANTTGKNFLPGVAALLDVAQISEITQVINSDTFVRPIYAGNALATVQSSDAIKVISVRTSAFEEVATDESQNVDVNILNTSFDQSKSQFVSDSLSVTDRPDLTSAAIVIAGGRGLANAENFALLEKLADKLGAAIGASRAAVDAGYVGNDFQIGQTGKIVAPDLYIAVGISGAIQHLAGMKESKIIVAINKDADAPIFQIADYGLVGDLFEILPELESLL